MNRNLRLAVLVALVLGLVAVAVFTGRARGPRAGGGGNAADSTAFRTFSTEVMATTITATLPDRPEAQADADTVFGVFRRVDAEMSEWKPTSPLSAVNREVGKEAVRVPADLRALIRKGIDLGEMTGGAFDITWAALWGLWDFRSPHPTVPDSAEAARRAALVDYRKVEIDPDAGTVRLAEPGMKIGLGGIAKGYALDVAARTLRDRGVDDFLLLGGGQVYAGGTRNGRPWRVGIRDPRGAPSDFFATLDVSDVSVSTSGDYESYFILNGVRYHHILDPRTGMPSRGLRSATVLSPDATLADALSTAIMVMGPKKGMTLVERLPNVEAVLVDDHGTVLVSSGLENVLVLLHAPIRSDR
jgi:thiamine biosynthesis lipoprotein